MKTTQLDLPRRRPPRRGELRGGVWRAICRLFPDSRPREPEARPSRPAPRSIQRFQVISVLGSGGMGTVYRALDPQLEREVAIKVLAHPAANATRTLSVHDTLDLKRTTRTSGVDLMSEARMMARLSHPNVLPVYEVGLADGALFVVMEHIDGCDLASWLSVPHKLDDILRVLAQAGRGLAAAHSRGIVHRDFKPENVLVGNNGRVCVADFGLSQLVNGDSAGLAQLRITAGTPGYMAPELLRGEPATIASDVFAFATAVAEALGCPPGACGEDRDRRLRERGVSFRLRSAITAGLAIDPAARCSLDVLISSIERRRWRWRWLAPATLVAALVGVIAIESTAAPTASCELTRSTWQLARRTELVLRLVLERGNALVEEMAERMVDIELPLRIMYVHSLATSRHDQHAVDVARETVEQVKQLVGDRDPNYAVARNMLAYALRCNSDLERALPIRRHALTVLLRSLPADDSHVMMQRADLADDLVTLGEFEQARLDYRRVLAASESNPTITGNRVKVLPAYALATFHSGRIDDGLHLQEQAYEESLVQFGPDHPWTLSVLWTGIELALETRDIVRAQRMLGVLHAGYRKRPEDALWAAVARGVLDADVAMLQRKPHVAENLAREALVRCGELNARDSQLVDVYFALGQSLRMQRKYSEAREALETAQRLAHHSQMRADAIAWIDVELATVDLGQGYHAEAYWRALHARAVLERFPGRLRARAQADAIIAKSRRS